MKVSVEVPPALSSYKKVPLPSCPNCRGSGECVEEHPHSGDGRSFTSGPRVTVNEAIIVAGLLIAGHDLHELEQLFAHAREL
jgi:hypothetical protein